MTTIIFGFGHRRYVGKDTCAELAISHIRATQRGVLTVKTGFASKMKAMCHDLYSWAGLQDEEYYEQNPALKDTMLEAIGKTVREVWIEFGTTVARAIFLDTWVVYPFKKKCDHLFIKDVRFPNEANMILMLGGKVFRVDNPRIEACDDVADEAMKYYTKWSGVIINDCDFQTLNKRVIEIIDQSLVT